MRAAQVWMAFLECTGRAVLTRDDATVECFAALSSDAIRAARAQAGGAGSVKARKIATVACATTDSPCAEPPSTTLACSWIR